MKAYSEYSKEASKPISTAPLHVFLIHGCVEAHASDLVGEEVYAGPHSQIPQINLNHGFEANLRRDTHASLCLREKEGWSICQGFF